MTCWNDNYWSRRSCEKTLLLKHKFKNKEYKFYSDKIGVIEHVTINKNQFVNTGHSIFVLDLSGMIYLKNFYKMMYHTSTSIVFTTNVRNRNTGVVIFFWYFIYKFSSLSILLWLFKRKLYIIIQNMFIVIFSFTFQDNIWKFF